MSITFWKIEKLENPELRNILQSHINNSLGFLGGTLSSQREKSLEYYQGEELEIGFNVAYLIDVMNALKTDEVKFNLSDSSASALIEDATNSTALYVIMPMRL